jgi:hypothetical protein
MYDGWREAMIELCDKPPNRSCPFCGEIYEDNAEYVDVGVGSVQVTANVCENPDCGAQEQGCYVYEGEQWEFESGWVRHKYESPSGPRKASVEDFDWEYLADLEDENGYS